MRRPKDERELRRGELLRVVGFALQAAAAETERVAVGDGGRGDAKLLGGADEALVTGGGLEEAQAFERGLCHWDNRTIQHGKSSYGNGRERDVEDGQRCDDE